MSGHRIELRITCTVSGREDGEAILRQFEYLADHGQLDNYSTDVEIWPSTVDGNGWHEKWPPRPKPVYRCGYLIERSDSVFTDRPGAYRVSKDGQSNIIGEKFYEELARDTDAAFEEFMAVALRPDFPHPFMYDAAL